MAPTKKSRERQRKRRMSRRERRYAQCYSSRSETSQLWCRSIGCAPRCDLRSFSSPWQRLCVSISTGRCHLPVILPSWQHFALSRFLFPRIRHLRLGVMYGIELDFAPLSSLLMLAQLRIFTPRGVDSSGSSLLQSLLSAQHLSHLDLGELELQSEHAPRFMDDLSAAVSRWRLTTLFMPCCHRGLGDAESDDAWSSGVNRFLCQLSVAADSPLEHIGGGDNPCLSADAMMSLFALPHCRTINFAWSTAMLSREMAVFLASAASFERQPPLVFLRLPHVYIEEVETAEDDASMTKLPQLLNCLPELRGLHVHYGSGLQWALETLLLDRAVQRLNHLSLSFVSTGLPSQLTLKPFTVLTTLEIQSADDQPLLCTLLQSFLSACPSLLSLTINNWVVESTDIIYTIASVRSAAPQARL